jgi:LEA14-like dessication related protein
MKSTYLWLLAAGAAALYFLPKISLGKRAIFLFRGVKISGKKLQLKIGVQNPTSNSATLQSFSGEIYADKKLVANISNFTPNTIAPNSETTLNFDVNLSAAGLVSTLVSKAKQIFQKTADKKIKVTKPKSTKIELKGSANVDGISVPVDINYAL